MFSHMICKSNPFDFNIYQTQLNSFPHNYFSYYSKDQHFLNYGQLEKKTPIFYFLHYYCFIHFHLINYYHFISIKCFLYYEFFNFNDEIFYPLLKPTQYGNALLKFFKFIMDRKEILKEKTVLKITFMPLIYILRINNLFFFFLLLRTF